MIESAARHGAQVGCCGTCLDARGITGELLVKGAHRSSLEELTDWTVWADQVIAFWIPVAYLRLAGRGARSGLC